MRIIAIVLGNLAALALLLGAAALFLTEFRQVSDKDIGLTDSEINQIIASIAGQRKPNPRRLPPLRSARTLAAAAKRRLCQIARRK